MKKNLLFSLFIILTIISCTKITNTEIGNGLIPPIDGINTVETTFNVESYNNLMDSFRISKYQDMMLGNIEDDDAFGKTKAIINAEFKPNYFPYYFEVSNKIDATTQKDSLKLDSVVLVLSYKGIYGDSVKPISYKVFEISQTTPLRTDSVYANTAKFNTAAELGSVTISDPRTLNDSVHPFQEAAANQLRIKLNNSFGNRLLKEFDSSNVYSSDAQFSNTFRGFSIVPQAGSNALIRINLQDTNSKVALYYKYTRRDNTGDTAVVRYFRATTGTCGASNNIERNRTGSASLSSLNNVTTIQDASLYLQAGAGNYVRIKTPGLKSLPNMVIHRAELLMEQDQIDLKKDTLYKAPYLFLAGVPTSLDSSTYRFYLPYDISIGQGGSATNLGAFGGSPIYPPSSPNLATYSFNITRYIQGIITRGEPVHDLYLFAPVEDYVYAGYNSFTQYQIYSSALNYAGFGRVKLFGGNSTQTAKRMRLRIVYSKL